MDRKLKKILKIIFILLIISSIFIILVLGEFIKPKTGEVKTKNISQSFVTYPNM